MTPVVFIGYKERIEREGTRKILMCIRKHVPDLVQSFLIDKVPQI